MALADKSSTVGTASNPSVLTIQVKGRDETMERAEPIDIARRTIARKR
jgi:hypothetical protein